MKRNYQIFMLGLRTCLLACLLLNGCVSSEPRQLVPSIALSPEDLELEEVASDTDGGLDFGLLVTINESDSLFNLEVLPGVRIREVSPGGPAAVAGLQAGDVILSVNGTAVNEPDTLAALARQRTGSANFTFQVRRGTAVLEASVMARERPAASAPLRELYRSDPLATRGGYQTAVLQLPNQELRTAARVVELAPDSPLHQADVRVGDIILVAGDTAVESAQGFVSDILNNHDLGELLSLSVYRDGQILQREVRLWDPGRRINRISMRPLIFYESSQATQQTRLSVFDFWLFSVYEFSRSESEREHQVLGLFSISSDYGELVEENAQP